MIQGWSTFGEHRWVTFGERRSGGSLRWQRLPAFKKLAATFQRHLQGILNYCHHKLPFGVVEAINANIRAVIRRGRGYRDHEYLILKVQKSTAQARLSRAAA